MGFHKPSLLRLSKSIPQKDIRKKIWSYIGKESMLMVEYAQNEKKKITITKEFLCFCAEQGHLQLFEWAEKYCQDSRAFSEIGKAAAKGGHIDMIKYLKAKNYIQDKDDECSAAEEAAFNGNIEAFEWMIKNGMCVDYYFCAQAAAINGQSAMLNWFKQKKLSPDHTLCVFAARSGCLETFKVATALGSTWNISVVDTAVRRGHWDIFRWILEHDGPRPSEDPCVCAAKSNNLDMLKWCKSREFSLESVNADWAVKGGNLEILDWMIDNGIFIWNWWLFKTAIESGHLHLLQWIKEKGFPLLGALSSWVAVGTGNVNVLEWIVSHNGGIWSDSECEYATELGHLHILKWAKEKGLQLEGNIPLKAVTYNRLDILKWAVQDMGCVLSDDLCVRAASVGSLDILKWLVEEKGCKLSLRCYHVCKDMRLQNWLEKKKCPQPAPRKKRQNPFNLGLDLM